MRFNKNIPVLTVSIICMILSFIELIYLFSIHGFGHLNSELIVNSIFAVSLFIGVCMVTFLFVCLILFAYVFKKINSIETRVKDNINIILKNKINNKTNIE